MNSTKLSVEDAPYHTKQVLTLAICSKHIEGAPERLQQTVMTKQVRLSRVEPLHV